MIKNIFYFNYINKFGGTEQFLYEIAKKYHDIDIAIYYDEADPNQLRRLRHYVRCIKRKPGEKVECEKAFYNYSIGMIEDIEAKEHIFVAHGIFQILKEEPKIRHPKLTKIIAVSDYAADMIKEYVDKFNLDLPIEKCYNPLTLEKVKKVKIIICACRLDDKVKGGERTLRLIQELDRYCENNTEEHYQFWLFTNPIYTTINSPNVILMKPRIDIRPYIATADYLVQLSDDMETYGYTINEALGYGVPVITTPLSVKKELNLTDDMHITLNWDCSNIKEVVSEIFNKPKKEFKYNLPIDNWKNILAKGKNKYNPNQITEVECIYPYYDMELHKDIPFNHIWKVPLERAYYLIDKGLARIKE